MEVYSSYDYVMRKRKRPIYKAIMLLGIMLFITGITIVARPDSLLYSITDIVCVDGRNGYLVSYACDGHNEIAGPFLDLREVEIFKRWLYINTNYTELRYGNIPLDTITQEGIKNDRTN